MNRRRFLAALGCAGAFAVTGKTRIDTSHPIEIRYWVSRQASRYAIHDRVEEYIESAFAPVFDHVELSFGGVVPVNTEHGYHVSKSGEWPMRAFAGRPGGSRTVRDANVLITDGPLGAGPLGVARFHFSSLGGARFIEDAPSREELGETAAFDSDVFVMQVLLHEIGHNLGLDHEHGSIAPFADGIVASPMVSAYAWQSPSDQFHADHSHCGLGYPADRDGERYLGFEFSSCARAELQRYRRWRR